MNLSQCHRPDQLVLQSFCITKSKRVEMSKILMFFTYLAISFAIIEFLAFILILVLFILPNIFHRSHLLVKVYHLLKCVKCQQLPFLLGLKGDLDSSLFEFSSNELWELREPSFDVFECLRILIKKGAKISGN